MAGYWEIWDIESGNLVGERDSEADALALVRDLIQRGWPVGALSLLAEDDAMPVEQLPPGVTGEELARRAEAAGADPVRWTA
jgi:hypothetical protein